MATHTELQPLNESTRKVGSNIYNVVKAWAPRGFSQAAWEREQKVAGVQVVHCRRLSGGKAGSIYDIITSA